LAAVVFVLGSLARNWYSARRHERVRQDEHRLGRGGSG
jgi:hypothetical protein